MLDDIETYENFQDSLAMLKIIAIGTKSMLEGKGQSVTETFSDIRKKVKESAAS